MHVGERLVCKKPVFSNETSNRFQLSSDLSNKAPLIKPPLSPAQDFSRISIFGPPDFFADFLPGFFLLIFVGKKCPEKSSRKIPGKILQNLYNKNPRHISAEGPAQSVVNLLRIVIRYSKYCKSEQNVVIHHIFSSESLRIP